MFTANRWQFTLCCLKKYRLFLNIFTSYLNACSDRAASARVFLYRTDWGLNLHAEQRHSNGSVLHCQTIPE
jgi:hypothetical protein